MRSKGSKIYISRVNHTAVLRKQQPTQSILERLEVEIETQGAHCMHIHAHTHMVLIGMLIVCTY